MLGIMIEANKVELPPDLSPDSDITMCILVGQALKKVIFEYFFFLIHEYTHNYINVVATMLK